MIIHGPEFCVAVKILTYIQMFTIVWVYSSKTMEKGSVSVAWDTK